MKKRLFLLAGIAIVSLTACNKQQNTSLRDDVVNGRGDLLPEPDAIPENAISKEGDTVRFEGLVTKVIQGTDGYIANVYLPSGEHYNVTVSIVNLKDPKQFKSVAVGDRINAIGEVFIIDNEIGVKAISFEVTE